MQLVVVVDNEAPLAIQSEEELTAILEAHGSDWRVEKIADCNFATLYRIIDIEVDVHVPVGAVVELHEGIESLWSVLGWIADLSEVIQLLDESAGLESKDGWVDVLPAKCRGRV